ncbi:MAG: hypothetical protein ACI9TH_002576 [Kiritimatiellia bacterium]|jgi:hypothetical protein
MNKGIIIGVLGIVAAGVCGGMLAKVNQEKSSLASALAQAKTDLAKVAAQPRAKPAVVERIVVAKAGVDPDAAAEIVRLKSQLAALKAAPTAATPDDAPAGDPAPRIEPPADRTPENMKSFMDRLKEEDPERYETMREQQKSFHERATQGFGERLTFLTELDVSGLSPENMETLTATVEKLSTMSEMLAAIEANPDAVEAFEMRGKARELMREVSDAMRATREVLVTDMITGLGFNEQESGELQGYLGQINEMTSMRSIFRPPQRTDATGDASGTGGGGGGRGLGPGRPPF